MIELNIPGRGILNLEHLVCDVNGTLALDGKLLEGLKSKIDLIQDRLKVHLLTADTHGGQATIDRQLNLQSTRLKKGNENQQKATYVRNLGGDKVIAIGQGANDADMLAEAEIGIGIVSIEGIATVTMMAADILVPDINAAFELLEKPLRLVASLRT